MGCLFCGETPAADADAKQLQRDVEEARKLARSVVRILLASERVELQKRYPWLTEKATGR